MSKWLRWIFRRGVRGTMLLNMQPGDQVVSMIAWQKGLAISTRYGELYLIAADKFDSPTVDDGREVLVHRVKP